MIFTKKQNELLRTFKDGKLKRINILTGSVRSGKTWISLVLWAFWILTMPKDATYLMAAKTLTTLKRNCLDLLSALVGENNFSYSLSNKTGVLFGRKIILEGASDARSEGKIRGLTLAGAYIDELTLVPEDFFVMLLSRLSYPKAKLFATTNPDNPRHFIKKNYLDRAQELDIFWENFSIDDNTFLPDDYIDGLKKEFTGVFYDRFILGKWVAAEGVIYRQFADEPSRFIKDAPSEIAFASVGVDFGGNMSATTFVLTGFTRALKEVVVLDEFYIKDKISPFELENYFVDFIKHASKKYRIYDAWCDNAETTLIRGLENAAARAGLSVLVRPAIKGRILDRIRLFNNLMSHGRFFVSPSCEHVIDALSTSVWEENSVLDKRCDNGQLNVDSLDALEYSVEFYMNDLIDLG
ncbi:MAG: PBSX family phage terminase large subunit [Clostridia bacterium]|nr:PBSX family phage terminase large subunit [Clostridia bacterium]